MSFFFLLGFVVQGIKWNVSFANVSLKYRPIIIELDCLSSFHLQPLYAWEIFVWLYIKAYKDDKHIIYWY